MKLINRNERTGKFQKSVPSPGSIEIPIAEIKKSGWEDIKDLFCVLYMIAIAIFILLTIGMLLGKIIEFAWS